MFFENVFQKKGACGELVSGVPKKWFTLEAAVSTDQIHQKFGGGACPSYATIYGTYEAFRLWLSWWFAGIGEQ